MIDFKLPEIVDLDLLDANDYNPNSMPNKEFELLIDCIKTYGFLFPIVVNKENERYVIIDGFHRYKALKKIGSEKASVINLNLTRDSRMKLTVLMNRIKGAHKVESMSNLVVSLSKLGVNDIDICRSLGMEAEEFIRLKQQLGIAHSFRKHEYSKSWEIKD